MSYQLRVLVIDDEVASLVPVVEVAQVLGCDTRMAFDGYGAVDEFKKKPADLIIVDWMMPYAGGEKALKMIDKFWESRSQSEKPIPFLIYSALEKDKIKIPETQNLEFLGHLPKPMTLADLTRKLSVILK